MEEDESSENRGEFCYITNLSSEIVLYIFSLLDARSIARAAQTCQRLHATLKFCDPLWKGLCRRDYDLQLRFRTPFEIYYDIYRFLSMARIVLRIYLSERFYSSGKYGILPGWLWTWIVLNTSAPRIPRWISTHREPYLRLKFAELPLGRIAKTWNLKAGDMLACRPARRERGTVYYSWSDVHRVALRKLGGHVKLQEFFLKRCSRAKKHIEKHYYLLDRYAEPGSVNTEPTTSLPTRAMPMLGTCGFSSFLRTW